MCQMSRGPARGKKKRVSVHQLHGLRPQVHPPPLTALRQGRHGHGKIPRMPVLRQGVFDTLRQKIPPSDSMLPLLRSAVPPGGKERRSHRRRPHNGIRKDAPRREDRYRQKLGRDAHMLHSCQHRPHEGMVRQETETLRHHGKGSEIRKEILRSYSRRGGTADLSLPSHRPGREEEPPVQRHHLPRTRQHRYFPALHRHAGDALRQAGGGCTHHDLGQRPG